MANPFDQFDASPATSSSNPFDSFDQPDEHQILKEKTIGMGKKALGGVEAVGSMVAGLPSMIAGGLHGLGALAAGQGYEQASKNVEDAQTSNFGFGAYQPSTKEGQKYAEAIGGAFAAPGEVVGDTLEKYVGPKTAFAGKTLTDMAMQFIDLGIPIGMAKGAITAASKGVEAAKGKGPAKVATNEAIAKLDELDAKKKAAKPVEANPFDQFDKSIYEQRAIDTQQAAILEQHIKGQQPITVDSKGNASTLGATGTLERQAPLERMASDLGAPKVAPDAVPSPIVRMAEDLVDHSTPEARAAQDAIAQRRKAVEQQVKTETNLQQGSLDRKRQSEAPVGSPEMVAERARVLEQERADRVAREVANQDPALAAKEAEARAAEQAAQGKTTLPDTPIYELAPNGTLRVKQEAIPTTELAKQSTMESAVEKVATDRLFAMSAEERVIWEKTKAAVQKVDGGFTKLSDKQVLSKMQDRSWVDDAVAKIKQRRMMFDEISKRSQDRQLVKEAQIKRELLTDQLAALEEALGPRPDTSRKAQGPKTLQAKSLNQGFKGQRGAIDPKVFLGKFPGFQASKIKDTLGDLKVMYHGTSKDTAFQDIKAGPTGAWLTDNPTMASEYAKQNDSQNLKYNPDTRKYDELNTAGRVMAVYANITNPYVPTPAEMVVLRHTTNYRKAQKALTEKASKLGHDAIEWGGGVYTAFNSAQIKSAFSPEFSKMKVPKGQQGALNIQGIADGVSDKIKEISALGFNHKSAAEEFASNLLPQVKEDLGKRITPPDSTESVIQLVS